MIVVDTSMLNRLLAQAQTGGTAPEGAVPVVRQKRNPNVSLTRPKPVSNVAAEQDDGFGVGDVFKPLGSGLMKVLRAVDIPRAALVSGTREFVDLFTGEDASLKDLRDQFNRRAGAQELLFTGPYFQLDEKGWEDEILGFATDVILDPLTYTGAGLLGKQAIKIGTKALPRTAAESSLRVAVKDGSSKMISKALAVNANEAGLTGSEAVQRLIANAATRGRGAITERGLVAAGVDDVTRQALGLSTIKPGTVRKVLQGSEELKGAVKQAGRQTAVAKAFRTAFVSEDAGKRAFINTAMDVSLPFEKRAGAVLASATDNPAKAIANEWGAITMERVSRNLLGDRKNPGPWFKGADGVKITDDVARQFTDNVEMGVQGVAEDAFRIENRRILKEAQDAKVDIGDLGENQVPHILTDKARDDSAVRQFITSIFTKEGSQKFRTLLPGVEFLNNTQAAARQAAEAGASNNNLVFGSIKEINERFREVYGYDLFYNDIREIMPRYIKQMERAIRRAKQIELLGEYGFTEDLAKKMVKNPDPVFQKKMSDVVTDLKDAAEQQRAKLRSGASLRRKELIELKKYTFARISDLETQVARLEKELVDWTRQRAEFQQKIDVAEAQVAVARQELQDLEVAVTAARERFGERAAEVRKAAEQLRGAKSRNNRKIRVLEDDIRKLQDQQAQILAKTKQYRGTAGARQQELVLQAEREMIRGRIRQAEDKFNEFAMLQQQLNDELMRDTDLVLVNASNVLEAYIKNRNNLMSAADDADAVFLTVQADKRFAIDTINRRIAELKALTDESLLGAKKVGKGQETIPARKPDVLTIPQRATVAHYNDMGNRFNTVMTVLQRDGNPMAVEAIAKLEAAAAKADLDVLEAGNQVVTLQKMFDDLAAGKMVQQFDDARAGMVKLGENMQMVDWVFEATKLDWVRNELPNIGRFGRKYFGLFKGYAILRPGFHVRNAYSAMFNMYLEAGPGALKNVKKWNEFYTMVTHNPEGYMDDAIKKFGADEARLLDQAFAATSATGGGQAASEFATAGFRKVNANPFDENNFALFRMSRKAGGWVEDHVRGAHAYDVLKRGGTVDQAVDIVTKWHFDYSDVTKFDQFMKLVNPFWIFFSRNMALQSQTWVSSASKVNRTIVNFERNMNYGLQEEGLVPQYYDTEGAVKMGIKGFGGYDLYLFTDLPAVTFPGEIDRLSDPTNARFFADLGPFLKVPFELASDKQLFSDIPIDRTRPERLPIGLGRGPIGDVLSVLPGFEQAGSGETVVNPEVMNVLRGLFPGLGQLERVAPIGNPKGQENLPYTAASQLLGLTFAERTPRAQQGEQYRRNLVMGEELKRLRRLQEM